MDLGTAFILGSTISAGSQAAGGLIAGSKKPKKAKPKTTLSLKQQQLNQVLMDFLLGIKRDPATGREIARYPLLEQFRAMPKPKYRVAPLTEQQKAGLKLAESLASRIGASRPNQEYLDQLKQGILPTDPRFKPTSKRSLKYMAKGGKSRRPFVAGEAGKETITVDKPTVVIPSGTATIKPKAKNLKGKRKLAEALGKAAAASKATGLPAAATGTPRYLWEYGGKKYYLDPNQLPRWDRPWDEKYDWAAPLRSEYEKKIGQEWKQKYSPTAHLDWLKENPAPVLKDYGGDISKWKPDYNKWSQQWLDIVQERNKGVGWYSRFQNQYGGDITKVPGYMEVAGAPEYSRQNMLPLDRAILENYYAGLQNYLQSLPQVRTNPELDAALSQLPESEQAGFGQWLMSNANKGRYGINAQNLYRLTEGRYTFEDPWSVDAANIARAVSDYLTERGYTQGEGGWQAPQPPAPPDWQSLRQQIPDSDIEDFNQFLENYQGGAFAGQGIKFNRRTGQMEFATPDKYFPGMQRAVADYLASKQQQQQTAPATGQQPAATAAPAATPAAAAPAAAQTPATTQPENIPTDLTPIVMGLASARFEPAKYEEEFTKGVYEPAMRQFAQHGRAAIRETYAGGNLFGSQREKAEQKALTDLQTSLAAQRARYVAGAREGFENRRLAAINQAMNLAQLPPAIADQKATTDYKKALAANLFHNMELREALTNADLTNAELAALATLMNIYQVDQDQMNKEWLADFKNAITGPHGLDLASVVNLLAGTISEPMILYA